MAQVTSAGPQVVDEAAEDQGVAKNEIVVTGTLIRGVAPAGANVLSIDQRQIEESGLTSTARISEQIPQLANFNSFQFPNGIPSTAVNRARLRSLPGAQASGSATTLVLMDGARLVNMGIASAGPDMDFIPVGAIARTEIVPDGGSAIYGSDAVAGVINFGTRRDYDGLEISGRSGFNGSYHDVGVDATVGRKWSTGSIYATYSYSQTSELRGYDLDFVQMQPVRDANLPGISSLPSTPVLSLNCSPGNVVLPASGTTPARTFAQPYAPGAGVPGTLNQCDVIREGVLFPAQRRHSALVGFSQELTDTIRLDIRGVYMNRVTEDSGTAFRPGAKTITGVPPAAGVTSFSSPFYSPFYAANQPVAGLPASQRNIVYFRFGPNDSTAYTNRLEAWQVTPTVTADLGSSWQLRVLGSYGWSKVEVHSNQFSDTALNNAIVYGLFNPYNPASSNPTVVSAISNYDLYAYGIQTLQNVRAVADGDLFSLPGGAVKLAFGGEFIRESMENQQSQGNGIWRGSQNTGFAGLTVGQVLGTVDTRPLIPSNTAVFNPSGSRRIWAAFGELVVPLFSEENGMPGLEELTLSAAGRYDSYSDVGDTFNPRFGLTWKPLKWVTVRAAYGTSFNAPSLADTPALNITTVTNLTGQGLTILGQPPVSLQQQNGGPFPAPGTVPGGGAAQASIAIGGVNANIQPQTSKTLSIGMDVDPPFVPGLRLSATYYQIDFQNQIGLPLNTFRDFPNLITLNPTAQQIADALAQAPLAGPALPCTAQGCVYAIVQSGRSNLGDALIRGLDFSARYRRETGFGSVDASFSGTIDLYGMRSVAHNGPKTISLTDNGNTFRFTATVGADVGDFRASATWRHSAGYELLTPAGSFAPFQTEVGAFDVVDLFFKYNWPKDNFSLTLNVKNVFNSRPPFSATGNGFTNGNTMGRLAEIGFTKKF